MSDSSRSRALAISFISLTLGAGLLAGTQLHRLGGPDLLDPVQTSAHAEVPKPASPAAQTSIDRGDQEVLGRASRAFNEIAHSAMPAVVSISALRRGEPPQPGGGTAPLRAIPGIPHGEGPLPPGMKTLGIGSGIIIRKDGLILTNNHVVENSERITITFDEKHKLKGKVVGTDPKTDLALVRIENLKDGPRTEYPVIAFGDSEKIREGDWAIAIGSPFGLNRSVSFGIISAKGRAQMGILDIEDFIQTDAAINPGSSGGPLLNTQGKLVGVNTAIFSQSGGNMGIGFAIPSKIAREISDELIKNGRVSRGWAGIMAQDLDSDLARFFKVPVAHGALVSEVVPTGPASLADFKSGDVVTRFDQQPIDGASSLKSAVGKSHAGSRVAVDVVRNGNPLTLQLGIREQPTPPGMAPATQLAGTYGGATAPRQKKPSTPQNFGLLVEDVPSEVAQVLHLTARKGTLVTGVRPGGPAFDAGISPGDIILSANRADIRTASDFKRMSKALLEKARESGDDDKDSVAVLYVQRGPAQRIYVPVRLKETSDSDLEDAV